MRYLELLKGFFFFFPVSILLAKDPTLKAILGLLFFSLDFFGAPVQAQKRQEKDKNK